MWEGFVFIGNVYAGFESPAADYKEEDIDLRAYLQPNPTSIYLARVRGDSMKNACIPNNSLVVIDKSLPALNGSIVIATLNGENIIKRIVKTTTGMFLAPENTLFKSIKITEGMDFAIWGVVTHVIQDLKIKS